MLMRFRSQERDEILWMITREIPALRRYARILIPIHKQKNGEQDDLVQDTLERAIKKIHTWRREGSIRSWLYRVQYTVFINRYHRTISRNAMEVCSSDTAYEDTSAGGDPSGERNLEYRDVLRAIEAIDPEQRQVLLLVAIDGLSYDQVAKIMNIAVATVRSRLSRAREKLRANLKREDHPVPDKTSAKARKV